jgi:beta-lactamase regulating signal transducer with metallopeptidase domain
MLSEPTIILDLFTGWAQRMFAVCWQGGLVLLLVWCLCCWWRTCPPQVRCWLWRIAYLKLIALFLLGGLVQVPVLPAVRPAVEAGSRDTLTSKPHAIQRSSTAQETSTHIGLTIAPAAGYDRIVFPTLLLLGGFMTWITGIGWGLTSLVRGQRHLQNMSVASESIVDPRTVALCEALCRSFGLRRIPRMATTQCVSPMLVGVFRPLILLPPALTQAHHFNELRLVLAHEIAHIKRRDLLWNLVPVFVRTVFFFHPMVGLAERRWSLAQELACDELTLAMTGARRDSYGNLLVNLSAHCQRNPQTVLATLGVASSFETLKARISAMNQLGNRSGASLIAASLSVLVIGLVTLIPFELVAQQVSSASSVAGENSVAVHERTSSGSGMISVVDANGAQSIKIERLEDGVRVTYDRSTDEGKQTRSYDLNDIEELRSRNKQAYDFYKNHTRTTSNSASGITVSALSAGRNSAITETSVATASSPTSTGVVVSGATAATAASPGGVGSSVGVGSKRQSAGGVTVASAGNNNSVDNLISQMRRLIESTDNARLKQSLQDSIDELRKESH